MRRCKFLRPSFPRSFPSALIIPFVDEGIFSISKSDVMITTYKESNGKEKRGRMREKQVHLRLFHVNAMTEYFTVPFTRVICIRYLCLDSVVKQLDD